MSTNEFLKQLRSEFSKQSLSENDIAPNPFTQFNNWLKEATDANVLEPIATSISTVSKYGQPSSRIVYIRDIQKNGFVFYTNYGSKKSNDLAHNPKACMNLFWPELERQIRIEGIIEKVDPAISDEYFKDRPKASQIGALASQQSEKLNSRADLEQKVQELTNKYANQEIPRPENWGGFILVPLYFEFWQGRKSRLHDRLSYSKEEDNWKIARLNP